MQSGKRASENEVPTGRSSVHRAGRCGVAYHIPPNSCPRCLGARVVSGRAINGGRWETPCGHCAGTGKAPTEPRQLSPRTDGREGA